MWHTLEESVLLQLSPQKQTLNELNANRKERTDERTHTHTQSEDTLSEIMVTFSLPLLTAVVTVVLFCSSILASCNNTRTRDKHATIRVLTQAVAMRYVNSKARAMSHRYCKRFNKFVLLKQNTNE